MKDQKIKKSEKIASEAAAISEKSSEEKPNMKKLIAQAVIEQIKLQFLIAELSADSSSSSLGIMLMDPEVFDIVAEKFEGNIETKIHYYPNSEKPESFWFNAAVVDAKNKHSEMVQFSSDHFPVSRKEELSSKINKYK